MKILKIKLGLLSLLAVLAVSVFLTSCEQNAIDIPDVVESGVDALSFTHNKDIEITSENGLSKATITVSANDVSLLDEIKQGDFKIIPIFEQPAEDLNQSNDDENQSSSGNTESFAGGTTVGITVKNVELEEGAIGYALDVKKTNYSRSFGRWTHFGSEDNVKVKRFFGCVRVEILVKQSWNTGYAYKLNSNKCNGETTVYRAAGSDQIQVIVSGSAAHRVTFF